MSRATRVCACAEEQKDPKTPPASHKTGTPRESWVGVPVRELEMMRQIISTIMSFAQRIEL
jgi:hypothetical protein